MHRFALRFAVTLAVAAAAVPAVQAQPKPAEPKVRVVYDSADSDPKSWSNLAAVGDRLVFTRDDSRESSGLWSCDNTGKLERIWSSDSGARGSGIFNIVSDGTNAYFTADGKVRRTDGTSKGTAVILPDLDGDLSGAVVDPRRGWLYFLGRPSNVETRNQLTAWYRTDGTPAGTVPLTQPRRMMGVELERVIAGDNFFFTEPLPDKHGAPVLWRSRGDAESTQPVSTAPGLQSPVSYAQLTAAGEGLYFMAQTRDGGGIWRVSAADGMARPVGGISLPPGTRYFNLLGGGAGGAFFNVDQQIFYASGEGVTPVGSVADVVGRFDLQFARAYNNGLYVYVNIRSDDPAGRYELWHFGTQPGSGRKLLTLGGAAGFLQEKDYVTVNGDTLFFVRSVVVGAMVDVQLACVTPTANAPRVLHEAKGQENAPETFRWRPRKLNNAIYFMAPGKSGRSKRPAIWAVELPR